MALTTEDIEKLTEYQQTVFATKKDLENIVDHVDKKFDLVMTQIDGLAKTLKNHDAEKYFVRNELDRSSKHIKQIAQKVGITLEY